MPIISRRALADRRRLDAVARLRIRRRRAQGNLHRLGELQSGVDDPQAKGLLEKLDRSLDRNVLDADPKSNTGEAMWW